MREIKDRFDLPNLFLIILIGFFSLGQVIQGYFWIDDNALIYKLQHLNENIGYWGKGAVGGGPYRHIINQFVPFYPIFKVNPQPYFAIGVIIHLLASLCLYIFILFLSKKKIIAFCAAAIFATGYIGLESILGITNSWQTGRGLIMALFTFWLYFKYLNDQKKVYYLLSLGLFFLSLDTVFIRSHGLLIALIFFHLLFQKEKINFINLTKSILTLAPFAFVYYLIYIKGISYASELDIWKIFQDSISQGRIYILTIPLQNFGNLFIPDVVTSIIDGFFKTNFHRQLPSEFSLGSMIAGIFILILIFIVIIKYLKEENYLTRVLIFSLIWVVANFIGFYARETTHTLWTTHRYFSYSFAGVALFWACLIYFSSKLVRRYALLSPLIFVLILMTLSFLSIRHQFLFNSRRNIPAKEFFLSFDREVPNIPKGSMIYFNISNNPKTSGEFGSFFGGMFSEGSNFAIYSEGIDYMNDFIFTYNFNDIIELLDKDQGILSNIFTFYYGENGLVNTTKKVRAILNSPKNYTVEINQFSSTTPYLLSDNTLTTETEIRKVNERVYGNDPIIKIFPPKNTFSGIPSTLTFNLRIAPLEVNFPYFTGENDSNIDRSKKSKILSYLTAEEKYRKDVVATSASYWKDQEPNLAVDVRPETSWRGHRGYWDEIDRGHITDLEFLQVDLGEIKRVGRVRWVSAQKPLIPTSYKIFTSESGKNWKLVKEVIDNTPLPEGTEVLVDFEPVLARFIKMEISKTLGNDGPELKEFEVIEEEYKDLDQNDIKTTKANPFNNINSLKEYENSLDYIKQTGQIKVFWKSNADVSLEPANYHEQSLILDGNFHNYTFKLPTTGTSWEQFQLEGIKFPAKVSMGDLKLSYEQ